MAENAGVEINWINRADWIELTESSEQNSTDQNPPEQNSLEQNSPNGVNTELDRFVKLCKAILLSFEEAPVGSQTVCGAYRTEARRVEAC